MTAYAMMGTSGGNIAIKAVNYEVRILHAEFQNLVQNSTSGWLIIWSDINVCTGATLSGGTAVTPAPMRGGSTAASAQCKSGSVSVSWATMSAVSHTMSTAPTFSTWDPPADIILAVGSALYIAGASGNITNDNLTINVYFEELRLSWHK